MRITIIHDVFPAEFIGNKPPTATTTTTTTAAEHDKHQHRILNSGVLQSRASLRPRTIKRDLDVQKRKVSFLFSCFLSTSLFSSQRKTNYSTPAKKQQYRRQDNTRYATHRVFSLHPFKAFSTRSKLAASLRCFQLRCYCYLDNDPGTIVCVQQRTTNYTLEKNPFFELPPPVFLSSPSFLQRRFLLVVRFQKKIPKHNLFNS